MKRKAPGKHYREGLSITGLFRMFPDNATAEAWFVKARWPEGVACPHCGSVNVQTGAKHKTMPYRCRDCHKRFSARTGTALESSNLGFQTWMIAIYMLTTGIKGVSSMKLHRDLNISQKSAWFLAHRLREAYVEDVGVFSGPVEADEAYIGGKRKNMHKHQREALSGRGSVGKTAVAGIKDRATKQVRAKVVQNTDGKTLQGFVKDTAEPKSTLYTDEASAYENIKGFEHEAVTHSRGEYVRGEVHTNGIESFWSMLKRGYVGTYHKMSPKHLDRYVTEFAGRHNQREFGTVEQMAMVVRGLDGQRLRYADLVR